VRSSGYSADEAEEPAENKDDGVRLHGGTSLPGGCTGAGPAKTCPGRAAPLVGLTSPVALMPMYRPRAKPASRQSNAILNANPTPRRIFILGTFLDDCSGASSVGRTDPHG
jgi:hypothetical protein